MGEGGGLQHTMVAPKLQQIQKSVKKNFLQRLLHLVFPMLFGQNDGTPQWGAGISRGGGGGVTRGGEGTFEK